MKNNNIKNSVLKFGVVFGIVTAILFTIVALIVIAFVSEIENLLSTSNLVTNSSLTSNNILMWVSVCLLVVYIITALIGLFCLHNLKKIPKRETQNSILLKGKVSVLAFLLSDAIPSLLILTNGEKNIQEEKTELSTLPKLNDGNKKKKIKNSFFSKLHIKK